MAVTAVRRAARDAGQQPHDGPLTCQALKGLPPHRGRRRPRPPRNRPEVCRLTSVLPFSAPCTQRRKDRPRARARRDRRAPGPRQLRGRGGCCFHGVLRRSEVAALRRTDVDLSDGEDVVVTLRRSKTNPADERPDVRRLVGGGAAAVRRLHAAMTPEPTAPGVGFGVNQINRRFRRRVRRGRAEGGQAVARRPRGARRRAHRPRRPERRIDRPAGGRRPCSVGPGIMRSSRSLSTSLVPQL